jgi:hypothetical protein
LSLFNRFGPASGVFALASLFRTTVGKFNSNEFRGVDPVMTKVDRDIVEREVSHMFDEHKTVQGVIEALLIETGWDANTIRAAQEARQKKQQVEKAEVAKREAKKKKKGSPQALLQQLAKEQKAEQVEDEKLVVAVEEPETEAEAEDERTAEEVPAEYEEIETNE